MQKTKVFLIDALFILALLNLCFLPSSFAAEAKNSESFTGIIIADSVNIRSGPSENFEILRKMNKDNIVLVIGQEQEWYKIKLPRQSKAYIHKKFLSPAKKNEKFAFVIANNVNIRSDKGTQFNIIGQLNKKDKVEIMAKEGQWYRIFSFKGCFAWVNEKYVENYGKPELYYAQERTNLKEKEILAGDDANITDESFQAYPAKIAKQRLNFLRLKTKLNQQINQPQTEPPPQAEGVVKELGIFLKRPGTHKLVKDGKTIYYLKSSKFNLNDFIYQPVEIWGGIKNIEKNTTPIIEVENIRKKKIE